MSQESDSTQDLKLTILNDVSKALEFLNEAYEKRFELLEERIETQDQQIAALMTAYLECVAVTEGVVTTLISSDKETREAFGEEVRKNRENMLEILQGVAYDVAKNDPKFTATVADAAREKLVDDSNASN